MRISDWSSDVCSSDLSGPAGALPRPADRARGGDRRPRAGRDRSRARPAGRAAAAAGEVPAAAAAGAGGVGRDRGGRAVAAGCARFALAFPRRARRAAAGQRRGRGGMNNTWKQRREGGGWFAIWLIRGIGRYGGRALARLFLYPITAYFLLRRTARAEERRVGQKGV